MSTALPIRSGDCQPGGFEPSLPVQGLKLGCLPYRRIAEVSITYRFTGCSGNRGFDGARRVMPCGSLLGGIRHKPVM